MNVNLLSQKTIITSDVSSLESDISYAANY